MMEESKEESIKDELKESYIKPSLDEMYAIILKGDDPCVYQVSEISETSNVVIMNAVSKKGQFIFELDSEYIVLHSQSLKYSILDIERVIPFDLDILKKDVEQLQKLLTSDIVKELDISLEEIKEKDIIYTNIELKEMLLSELIHLYDAYDKYSLIKTLNLMVNEYIILLKDKKVAKDYLYNLHLNKALPKWLIPVADNPLKLYNNNDNPTLAGQKDKAFDDLNDINDVMNTNNNYNQNIHLLLDSNRPIESSISDVGISTNTHHGSYLRDCLQEDTCIGIKGNYKYDKRTNKRPYSTIYDSMKQVIHQSDTLNIVGLLYIPDNHLVQGYSLDTSFTMKEKTIIQHVIDINSKKLIQLKNLPMLSKPLDDTIDLNELDMLIHYSINDRLDITTFNTLLTNLIPTIQQLLSSMDTSITSKLINYKDIKTVFSKYNLDPDKLSSTEKNTINELIESNIKSYLKSITQITKVIINIKVPSMTIQQKMSQSKDIIMNMLNIPKRNEYLKKFIKVFTREAHNNEDKLWLYNVYTNEPLLCKHYLYSSIYHTDKDAFKSLISVYGKPAEDGVIYCKRCGEFLCDEDFSEFDGFNGEQPVIHRAVMDDDIHLLQDFKESQILIVKLLSKNIGVSLEDVDIKLILDIFNTFNDDIIANIRYLTMNITNEHPIIQDIAKQYQKDKNKKKKERDTKEFQLYLKDTNKMISLLSLMIIIIQTSIPKYNLKNNVDFTFLEFDKTDEIVYNKKIIDLVLHKIHKNIDIYKTDSFWLRYHKLVNEHKTHDTHSTKEQIQHVVTYIISPQYPDILSRIKDYKTFIHSTKQEYIKPEWVIFKPLRHNKLIKSVDTLLKSKIPEHKQHFILNYNNYPVENISLVESIHNDTLTYKLLKIPISEIMVNNAFILLFKICVSNYGVSKGYVNSVNLHMKRFLETITDKDVITGILSKHGFNENKISYKVLRTNIIPDIITHFQKSKQDLEACYSNESICNRFIHININNYELTLLKGTPKRHAKYIAPTIYPDNDYNDISDEFKDKIFKRYCKDPSGNIIIRSFNDAYLGKVIINIADELDIDVPDTIRDFEKELTKDITNFKDVLQYIQSRLLPLSLYYTPKQYGIDDYNIDIYRHHSNVERNILEVFLRNRYYELEEDHPIIHHLNHYIQYISANVTNVINDNISIKRDFENAFSLLVTDGFIDNISLFISQCSSNSHKKRLENIFINTSESININQEDRDTLEGDGFRYKNLRQQDIHKILDLFSNDVKLTSDTCISYIYRIQFILSNFSNLSEMSPHIPKQWKLSDTNQATYKQYIESNRFVLHKDIFKLKPLYRGFYESFEPYIYSSLLDYISPYINDLYKLRTNPHSLIDPVMLFLINKYILVFIINKLIEFHSKLQSEDEEILSLLESNLRKHNIDEELDILHVTNSIEMITMDIITEILQIHYDSRWILSNMNKQDLVQRLSKQREREKQTLIQKLDTMSDDKRASARELQSMGITNQFKASAEKNAEYMLSDERENATESERIQQMNEIFKGTELEQYVNDISTGESSDMNPNISINEAINEAMNETLNNNDEDGQMNDESRELMDEDLLDE